MKFSESFFVFGGVADTDCDQRRETNLYDALINVTGLAVIGGTGVAPARTPSAHVVPANGKNISPVTMKTKKIMGMRFAMFIIMPPLPDV